MFWTSKDKPSASDTATQSCSLWQRWVSERNIGRSSVLTNSFPGFSGLDSLRLCFLPDFSPGHSWPGLSNIGLLQPAGDQLPVWRTSEWRVSHSVTTRLVLLMFCPRFYSDEEAFCQMYHMCVAESSGSFKKFSFLCPNGQPTVHSQLFYLLHLSQAQYSTKRSWSAMPGSMLTVPKTPSPMMPPHSTFWMPRGRSSPSGWSLTSPRRIILGDSEVQSRWQRFNLI